MDLPLDDDADTEDELCLELAPTVVERKRARPMSSYYPSEFNLEQELTSCDNDGVNTKSDANDHRDEVDKHQDQNSIKNDKILRLRQCNVMRNSDEQLN